MLSKIEATPEFGTQVLNPGVDFLPLSGRMTDKGRDAAPRPLASLVPM